MLPAQHDDALFPVDTVAVGELNVNPNEDPPGLNEDPNGDPRGSNWDPNGDPTNSARGGQLEANRRKTV